MRRYLAIAIVFVLLLLAVFMAFTVAKTTILVDQASASHSARTTFVWSYVGGDPLIPGGVWTKAKFISLMKHSAKVRAALKLVVRANGDPEWVLPAAYKNLRNSKRSKSTLRAIYRTIFLVFILRIRLSLQRRLRQTTLIWYDADFKWDGREQFSRQHQWKERKSATDISPVFW